MLEGVSSTTILTIGVLSGIFLVWYAHRLRTLTNLNKQLDKIVSSVLSTSIRDSRLGAGRENYANQIVHGGVGSIAGPVVTPYPGYSEDDLFFDEDYY